MKNMQEEKEARLAKLFNECLRIMDENVRRQREAEKVRELKSLEQAATHFARPYQLQFR